MNGRPVRLAPCLPGARPTIASQASAVAERRHRRVPPAGMLGAAFLAGSATSRGHNGQSRGASASGIGEKSAGWTIADHLPLVLSEVEGRSFSYPLRLTPFDCALRAPLRTNEL